MAKAFLSYATAVFNTIVSVGYLNKTLSFQAEISHPNAIPTAINRKVQSELHGLAANSALLLQKLKELVRESALNCLRHEYGEKHWIFAKKY